MSDDWSLKEKKHYDGWYTSYSDNDIETIRRKLIEDFAVWYFDEIHGEKNFDDFEKQINKRFGVENEITSPV